MWPPDTANSILFRYWYVQKDIRNRPKSEPKRPLGVPGHGERGDGKRDGEIRERFLHGFRRGEPFGYGERPLGKRDDEKPFRHRHVSEYRHEHGRGVLRSGSRCHDRVPDYQGEEARQVRQSPVSFEISHQAFEHLPVR